MILDLQLFLGRERPYWDELGKILESLENEPFPRLGIDEARRLHYLYQRAASDLVEIRGFAMENETREFLERLVSRAYGELSDTRRSHGLFRPLRWFAGSFPRSFRKHSRAFLLALALTVAGGLFGAFALFLDPGSKESLMPFPQLLEDPARRIAREEAEGRSPALKEGRSTFSSFLLRNNVNVAINTMALGLTWGIGTAVLLLYNGIILGAVCADYVCAGKWLFLAGWLLPHGVVEIPAILIAGQCGFVLASVLIGRGRRERLLGRLRAALPDLANLIGGVVVLLAWAALVEAFLSQYHQPVLPYWMKIGLGVMELALLTFFLAFAGRSGAGREYAGGGGAATGFGFPGR